MHHLKEENDSIFLFQMKGLIYKTHTCLLDLVWTDDYVDYCCLTDITQFTDFMTLFTGLHNEHFSGYYESKTIKHNLPTCVMYLPIAATVKQQFIFLYSLLHSCLYHVVTYP